MRAATDGIAVAECRLAGVDAGPRAATIGGMGLSCVLSIDVGLAGCSIRVQVA
jgi:hypothetical protein